MTKRHRRRDINNVDDIPSNIYRDIIAILVDKLGGDVIVNREGTGLEGRFLQMQIGPDHAHLVIIDDPSPL